MPSPLLAPHLAIKVPSGASFWIRWFQLSATKTLPVASRTRPLGELNSASPEPWVPSPLLAPHLAIKVPSGASFWIRWLPLSATKTLPAVSRARP